MYTAEPKAETRFESAPVKFPHNPSGKPGCSARLRHDLSKVIQKAELIFNLRLRCCPDFTGPSDVPPAKARDTWMLKIKMGPIVHVDC